MDMSMPRRPWRRVFVKVAASAAALVCLGTAAARPSASAEPAQAEIEARIDLLERLWAAGDAPGLVEQLYTDDIVIAGEGMPAPVVGKQQARELVAELIEGSKTAEVELKRFKQLGPEAASSWVVWHLPPPEGQSAPMLVRSLLVWEKQDGVWRMSGDMYSLGPF